MLWVRVISYGFERMEFAWDEGQVNIRIIHRMNEYDHGKFKSEAAKLSVSLHGIHNVIYSRHATSKLLQP